MNSFPKGPAAPRSRKSTLSRLNNGHNTAESNHHQATDSLNHHDQNSKSSNDSRHAAQLSRRLESHFTDHEATTSRSLPNMTHPPKTKKYTTRTYAFPESPKTFRDYVLGQPPRPRISSENVNSMVNHGWERDVAPAPLLSPDLVYVRKTRPRDYETRRMGNKTEDGWKPNGHGDPEWDGSVIEGEHHVGEKKEGVHGGGDDDDKFFDGK